MRLPLRREIGKSTKGGSRVGEVIEAGAESFDSVAEVVERGRRL